MMRLGVSALAATSAWALNAPTVKETIARATEARRHSLPERHQKGDEKRHQTFTDRAVPTDEQREGAQTRMLKHKRPRDESESKGGSKGGSKEGSKGGSKRTETAPAVTIVQASSTRADETRAKLRNMELGAAHHAHRASEHSPSGRHRTKTDKDEPHAATTLSSPTSPSSYSSHPPPSRGDKMSGRGHGYSSGHGSGHSSGDSYDHWNHYDHYDTKSGKSGGTHSSSSYDHYESDDHWNHHGTKTGKWGKSRHVSTGVCDKRLHLAFEQITDLGPGEGPFGVVNKPSDVTDLCEFTPPTPGEAEFNFGCPFLYVPEFGFLEGEDEYVAIFEEDAGRAFQSFVLYCECHQGFELGCAAKVPHGPPATTREYTDLGTGEMETVAVNGYSEYIPFGKPADRVEYCKLVGVWNGDFDSDIVSDLDEEVVDCGCFFIGQAKDMVDQCPGVELGAFFEFPPGSSLAPTTPVPSTLEPTMVPSFTPTGALPTFGPTPVPTLFPTQQPTLVPMTTLAPTLEPTAPLVPLQ